MINPKNAPYHGQLLTIFFLLLPPSVLTLIFYFVIAIWQSDWGFELNFASAKIFGCGCGALFHFSCSLTGAFNEERAIVKNRVKEFFLDVFLSPKVAFTAYFDDIRSNGVAYWIDLSVILLNLSVFVGALLDFLSMRGITLW